MEIKKRIAGVKCFNRILGRLKAREAARKRTKIFHDLKDKGEIELIRVGTAYGGWKIPASVVVPGKTAICVGAGEDISFDVELNKNGMSVFTVDPTPRAKRHVEGILKQVAEDIARGSCIVSGVDYDLRGFDLTRFNYFEYGLSDQNKVMRFWAPKDPDHVSHSLVNLQHSNRFFEAKCLTLEALRNKCGIDRIDILKLDIEGAEYSVLNSMISSPIRPEIVCCEFDELNNALDHDYLKRIVEIILKMKRAGYRFVDMEEANALFTLDRSPVLCI